VLYHAAASLCGRLPLWLLSLSAISNVPRGFPTLARRICLSCGPTASRGLGHGFGHAVASPTRPPVPAYSSSSCLTIMRCMPHNKCMWQGCFPLLDTQLSIATWRSWSSCSLNLAPRGHSAEPFRKQYSSYATSLPLPREPSVRGRVRDCWWDSATVPDTQGEAPTAASPRPCWQRLGRRHMAMANSKSRVGCVPAPRCRLSLTVLHARLELLTGFGRVDTSAMRKIQGVDTPGSR
jgi:hypothetical protein